MVIHSVTPIQMLMETPAINQAASPQLKQTSFGYLEGVPCENGLMIARIISTDPAVYLNPQYAPGAIYR